MKSFLKHIAFLLLLLSFTISFGQSKKVKGYRIDGDDIVFTFDKNDYKRASNSFPFFRRYKDFSDIDIESVVVAGEFNNWSMKNWKMKKINNDLYELRKKMDDFSDEFTWEFKFVVNNYYWAEPSKKHINSVPAIKNGVPLYVYNLNLFTLLNKEDGNSKFQLKGFPNAEKVVLAGSFNKWNEEVFQMKNNDGIWELTLDLKPGYYEYKFIVDGNWMEDPDNPLKKENEHGTLNSILRIDKEISFNLNGFPDAREVILCGSFNDWNEQEIKMSKTQNGWTFSKLLKPGKHHYKYIVDGKWITDPFNSVKEYDDKGNINSVIIIK